MEFNSKQLSNEIATAAAGLLKPAFPGINNEILVKALSSYSNKKGDPVQGKLLSVKEYCSLVSCSKPTAFRHIRDGKVRAVKIGGLTRIPESELLKFTDVAEFKNFSTKGV